MEYEQYFAYRRVSPTDYQAYRAPNYVLNVLGTNFEARLLDFGCGYGQLVHALQTLGYHQVEGLDIASAAIAHCRSQGTLCHDGRDEAFFPNHQGYYDYIVMSHVVEHFPKEEIIPLLDRVRSLLKPTGAVIVAVPNGQSHTGAYWAYEDFTHYTLFTAGSLYYALMAAGYSEVQILDPDCFEETRAWKRPFRRFLLGIYKANYKFWNRVTSSALHAPSGTVFSFEVKALARR